MGRTCWTLMWKCDAKCVRLQIQNCSDYSDVSDIPDSQVIPRCSKYEAKFDRK